MLNPAISDIGGLCYTYPAISDKGGFMLSFSLQYPLKKDLCYT